MKNIMRTVLGLKNGYPHEYDPKLLPEDDQVRVGFQKGTLKKATFELHNGHTIIYEEVDD